MLAAILESGEPSRLYTGLSLLVSTAAGGDPARGLVSFGALPALLEARFEPHLAELWSAARELEDLRLWACAAAVDVHGSAGSFAVMSTPRFLRETAGARLVVV
jgi:peroxiredoxin family protein